MVARLQGFPDDWKITGRKTAAYRQVGNAFPPPVARALGTAIAAALAPSASLAGASLGRTGGAQSNGAGGTWGSGGVPRDGRVSPPGHRNGA